MLICKNCGAECCDEAIFCSECGSRIDSKIACKACGMVFEGNFCPECGTPAKQEKTTMQQPCKKTDFPIKRISKPASDGFMLAGILFALIFVFFIGIVPMDFSTFQTGGKESEINLYYFFGKIYQEIDASKIIDTKGPLQYEISLMWRTCYIEYAVIGTILSAAILLVVVGTAITALTLYALNRLNKIQKSPYGWGMVAIISFLVAVCLFGTYSQRGSLSILGIKRECTAWTGATTAGFVLCAVCGSLSIAAKILSQGKVFLGREHILKTVRSLVPIAFVCMGLIAISGLGIREASYVSKVDSLGMQASDGMLFSFMLFNTNYLRELSLASFKALGKEQLLRTSLSAMTTINFINQLLTLALFVCVAILFISLINNAYKKKTNIKKPYVITIVAFAITLTILVLCIVNGIILMECDKMTGSNSFVSPTIIIETLTGYLGNNTLFTIIAFTLCFIWLRKERYRELIRWAEEYRKTHKQ